MYKEVRVANSSNSAKRKESKSEGWDGEPRVTSPLPREGGRERKLEGDGYSAYKHKYMPSPCTFSRLQLGSSELAILIMRGGDVRCTVLPERDRREERPRERRLGVSWVTSHRNLAGLDNYFISKMDLTCHY